MWTKEIIHLISFFKLFAQRLTDEQKFQFHKTLTVKVEKFGQTAMEQIVYGLFAYFGYIMVRSQTWSWPSKHWWMDFDKTDSTGRSLHSFMTEVRGLH